MSVGLMNNSTEMQIISREESERFWLLVVRLETRLQRHLHVDVLGEQGDVQPVGQGRTGAFTSTEGRGLSRRGKMYGDQQEAREQVERIQLQTPPVLRLPEQSLRTQWRIITLYN